MSATDPACPVCGANADPEAERCETCGVRLKPRKRAAAGGVRIDPDRLEAIADLDFGGGEARWGTPSEPPAASPAPEAAADPVVVAAAAHVSPMHPERRVGDRREHASAAPKPADAESFQVPLDAEVVIVAPSADGEPQSVAQARPAGEQPRSMAARPPVLASEALLRDLTPAEPAPRLMRFWTMLIGTLGLAVVTLATGQHGLGIPLSVLMLALVVLGIPPIPYSARATAVLVVSGSGLSLVLWTEELARAVQPRNLVLSLAVTLLASGLLLRSWHRASLLARTLVVFGLGAGIAYLSMNEALRHLTMLDTAWQSWAPRLLAVVLCLLLMLSMLAFMDARSTGGCSGWALAVLAFHAVSASLDLLRASWPKGDLAPNLARMPAELLLAWIVAPLFNAAFALALAQVLAATMARDSLPMHEPPLPSQRPT